MPKQVKNGSALKCKDELEFRGVSAIFLARLFEPFVKNCDARVRRSGFTFVEGSHHEVWEQSWSNSRIERRGHLTGGRNEGVLLVAGVEDFREACS